MACDLGPDMWGILGRGTPRHWVKNNDELLVKVNQHGAMSVVTPYGDLGVKPLECEIIEWRAPNDELSDGAGEKR
jgi:homogentisate 1,2-dioxygenase